MPTIRRKQPPRSRHCERSHLSAEAFGEGGSNPESFHGGILDCFVASAQNCFAILSRPPRHDGARGGIAILQHAAQIADTPSQPRGLNHPSFASSFTLFNQRGCREDRVLTSHPRSAARNARAEKPHSSIQVAPITRPSLRDGRTAYAVLSREPNFPSGLPRRSNWTMPSTRLGSRASSTGLTVATTARTTRFCRTRSAPLVRTKPRAHRDYPPCPRLSHTTLPRPPQPGPRFERLANRPSSSGRAASTYAANPNFGKVEYFCKKGLTRRRHSGVISCRMGRAQRNPSCFHERRTMMGFAALYPSYKLRPFNSAPRIVHRRHIPTDRRPNPAGRYRAPRGGERTMAPNRGPD